MPAGDTDPRSGKSTVDQSWHTIVSREDPDRIRELSNEIYYIMSNGRIFYAPKPPGIYIVPEEPIIDLCGIREFDWNNGPCNILLKFVFAL